MIIGITGAFGSGKSTVLSAFYDAGWQTHSLDAWVHELYDDPGQRTFLMELAARWGADILRADGRLERRAVGKIVFNNPEEMEFLCEKLHPLLRRRLGELIALPAPSPIAVEVPLLFESDWSAAFDLTLAVWAPRELRVARLAARGFSAADMLERERLQLPADVKLERADCALLNIGSEEQLRRQCNYFINHLEF